MKKDFMLQSELAIELYEKYAKDLPIIDYHNHLDPQMIAENYKFENIYEMWVAGDHYKWRAMRTLGIIEDEITGLASDEQKFNAWQKILPYTIQNPLNHWSILELDKYFDLDVPLSQFAKEYDYKLMNKKIEEKDYTVGKILNQFKIEALCTTDDPTDDLNYHKQINESGANYKVLPTFRPDKLFYPFSEGFAQYLQKLGEVSEIKIETISDLQKAIESRVKYFKDHGCVIADHGMTWIYYADYTLSEIEQIFAKNPAELTQLEIEQFYTFINVFLAELYTKYEIKLQIHYGALRNLNKKMFNKIGADTGFDAINDQSVAQNLSALLSKMNDENNLPPTIIYNLNPTHNQMIASIIGAFQEGPTYGKIQHGSGWWFNDTKIGMENQLEYLASIGQLAPFVGMLTDSRSFMSFPRHDYFRRILCNKFAEWIAKGEIVENTEFIGSIIEDICYNNIKKYLNI